MKKCLHPQWPLGLSYVTSTLGMLLTASAVASCHPAKGYIYRTLCTYWCLICVGDGTLACFIGGVKWQQHCTGEEVRGRGQT